MAFGDFDNDGDIDIVINNVNNRPVLFCLKIEGEHHWIKIQLVGTQSNRSGIGARVECKADNMVQIDEVRSGGSYLSQSDFRVHFGVGSEKSVDELKIIWPTGTVDVIEDLPANQIVTVKEGKGVVARMAPASEQGD